MTLVIKPISAALLHDTEMFANMDPYVKVFLGITIKISSVHHGGGKHPRWSDTFIFSKSQQQVLKFELWDKDLIQDDLIGTGMLQLKAVYANPNVVMNPQINLVYKGKSAGNLSISVEYQAPVNNYNQKQPTYNNLNVNPYGQPQKYNQNQQNPYQQINPYPQNNYQQVGWTQGMNQYQNNNGWSQNNLNSNTNNLYPSLENNNVQPPINPLELFVKIIPQDSNNNNVWSNNNNNNGGNINMNTNNNWNNQNYQSQNINTNNGWGNRPPPGWGNPSNWQ